MKPHIRTAAIDAATRLDVIATASRPASAAWCRELGAAGIRVSLFVDPEPAQRRLAGAPDIGRRVVDAALVAAGRAHQAALGRHPRPARRRLTAQRISATGSAVGAVKRRRPR